MGSAWAAGGEHAAETSFFADPETWVAVAFLLFVAVLGRLLWARITALLDKRSRDIAHSLSEAERLRAEAAQAKAEAERTLAQATAEAEGIVAQAREEATRMQQRAAAKQVRNTAVDVALSATRALLREQVGADQTQALVDAAIAELPRRLH